MGLKRLHLSAKAAGWLVLNWNYGAGIAYIYAPVMKKLYTRARIFGGYFPQLQEFTIQTPSLLNWVCDVDFPALKKGMFAESSGKSWLHPQSVLRVLNSIPTYSDGGTYTLSIGIHIDHQNDPEILEAIANAEAKGWTLTVQWNGEPTSTTSTMAMGSLIYAKVGECELSDGTTEQYLDWGHYVTDETGYETFRSLESAYEYFGLENSEIE